MFVRLIGERRVDRREFRFAMSGAEVRGRACTGIRLCRMMMHAMETANFASIIFAQGTPPGEQIQERSKKGVWACR